ncbi:SRPBCC domain-containing protein [Pedobacter sp. MC2016-05]|uniref:SRPBCC family protein n=1 Tax=Pedobacter sp. MC2016-05 TaxID=2994474 RepID=UPI002247A85A|nr:SRPBCC domain-containing protein [Pedobacter sp. MC2016-05]MCX2474527.1 SRPBCC domain-containing protein [Pedobacter sp. MC2016-05]
MDAKPLIVECVYNVPIDKVWQALTDNNQLKQWYFQSDKFEPRIGFKFDFIGGAEEGPKYLHLCEITEVDEEAVIAYSCKYDNYPGSSRVKWEIFVQGNNTRLKLTHTGAETFAENGKDFQQDSFKAEWNYFVNDALKNFLQVL